MRVEDPVAFRNKIVNTLNGFVKDETVSRNIEKSIYNKTIDTSTEYKIIKR